MSAYSTRNLEESELEKQVEDLLDSYDAFVGNPFWHQLCTALGVQAGMYGEMRDVASATEKEANILLGKKLGLLEAIARPEDLKGIIYRQLMTRIKERDNARNFGEGPGGESFDSRDPKTDPGWRF